MVDGAPRAGGVRHAVTTGDGVDVPCERSVCSISAPARAFGSRSTLALGVFPRTVELAPLALPLWGEARPERQEEIGSMTVFEDWRARRPLWANGAVEVAVLCAARRILITSRNAARRAAIQRLLAFSNRTGEANANLNRRGEPARKGSTVNHRKAIRAHCVERAACPRTLACLSRVTDRNAGGFSVNNATPGIFGAFDPHGRVSTKRNTFGVREDGIANTCIPAIAVINALRRRAITCAQFTLPLWLVREGDACSGCLPRCVRDSALLPRGAILATDAAAI